MLWGHPQAAEASRPPRARPLALMLLRLTSSSAPSLAWICRSVSSTLVGFGGSSGTGLYVSGFTTPAARVSAGGRVGVCAGTQSPLVHTGVGAPR